jgi:hypothetical protein
LYPRGVVAPVTSTRDSEELYFFCGFLSGLATSFTKNLLQVGVNNLSYQPIILFSQLKEAEKSTSAKIAIWWFLYLRFFQERFVS